MTFLWKSTVLLLLSMMVFSCFLREEEEIILPPLKADEISGERLWQRINEQSPYQNYGEWEGHDGLRPGQSPHGVLHRVYVNDVLKSAVPLTERIAPEGTIIVKENYTPGRELDKLTVMAKVEGYSPDTNDWFWAIFSPEGEVVVEGSPMGCLSCHSGMDYNDYIIIKDLDDQE